MKTLWLLLLLLMVSSNVFALTYNLENEAVLKCEFRPSIVDWKQRYALRLRVACDQWFIANTVRTQIDEQYGKPSTYDKFIIGYKITPNYIIRAVNIWGDTTFWGDHVNTNTLNFTILY
jgi:hypothetical protein